MRRKLLKTLLLCIATSVPVLSGCDLVKVIDNTGTKETCTNHVDSDKNGLCDNCGSIMNKNFSDLVFESQTFEYDGKSHSLVVQNVPQYATVNYVNNNKTEPGIYEVTATVSAPNYNSIEFQATLTILNVFKNLKFNNKSYDYDGQYHTITVENVPDFAKVTYNTTQGYKAVGTYTITAKVEADGYATKELSAKLTINSLEFKGITFESKTFAYDGYYHYIYVEGAPSFANVSYSNNGKCEKGTYTVTATISATNYKTLTLTAKLTIAMKLPIIESLVDRTLIYDGDAQTISFEYPDNLPRYTDATFKVDGKTVDEDNFKVTTAGTHTVSVTLSSDGYDSTTTTAKIKVVENTIGGVDSTKTPFRITNETKFQKLRSEILKGNFTIKKQLYNDRFYPDGTEEHIPDDITMYYFANNEMFSYYDMMYKDDNFLDMEESVVHHAKIINGEVLDAVYSNGLLNFKDEVCEKYPASAWEENYVGRLGLRVLAYLKEASDGGFENGSEGGYSTIYGFWSIDEANNSFTLETRSHYYHSEFNHDEVCYYTIYNIGNTKINMIDDFNASKVKYDNFEKADYYIDGIRYVLYGTYIVGYPAIDSISNVYLERKDYIVPAYVWDLPVTEFETSFYDSYMKNDCSGLTYKVYYDSDGYYQGEYESIGRVKYWGEINIIEDDGGDVLYYGEW